MNHNPLQKVEANAFEMIPQLVSLDLSHCEIKRVAAKAFNQIEALEKLYLNSNQIKEIKQKTVDTIRGLSDKFHSNALCNAPTMRRLFKYLISEQKRLIGYSLWNLIGTRNRLVMKNA